MESVTEIINVKFVGPYGPNVNGVFYRLGNGVNVNAFKAGMTYEVECGLGKTKKGELVKYINKIVGIPSNAATASPLDASLNQSSKSTITDNRPRRTKFGDPLSEYDLDLDGKIRRSGLVQAAVQAVASHVSKKEDIAPAAILVASELLKWVENK